MPLYVVNDNKKENKRKSAVRCTYISLQNTKNVQYDQKTNENENAIRMQVKRKNGS